MKKEIIYRWGFYLLGLISLAAGLALTTQVALGVSPIISVAFTFSQIWNLNFGDATFIWYSIFVLVEVLIHISMKRYKEILPDLLQIVLSLVFSRFLNVFKAAIPDFKADLAGTWLGTIGGRLLFLAVAIILTGVGAAMSLDMRILPNPGDGIVQAIADRVGKTIGFTKNCVDIGCVALSCLIGLLVGQIYGVGIGTVCCMILVGRVIAVFNHFLLAPIGALSGLKTDRR